MPVLDDNNEVRDDGRKTFYEAQAQCLLYSDSWPYKTSLLSLMKRSDLDYMSIISYNLTEDGTWIDIDNIDSNGHLHDR